VQEYGGNISELISRRIMATSLLEVYEVCIEVENQFKLIPINKEYEEESKQLILEGFLEYFGNIDQTLNPDLNNLYEIYSKKGNIFLIGLYGTQMIGTGGLLKEDEHTARIVRMSVKKAYRSRGFARTILKELEFIASVYGYKKIVLETNNEWIKPINLYKSSGFIEYLNDGQLTHMVKLI
jgi:GNAT superfamily N-acetyltransferase